MEETRNKKLYFFNLMHVLGELFVFYVIRMMHLVDVRWYYWRGIVFVCNNVLLLFFLFLTGINRFRVICFFLFYIV